MDLSPAVLAVLTAGGIYSLSCMILAAGLAWRNRQLPPLKGGTRP